MESRPLLCFNELHVYTFLCYSLQYWDDVTLSTILLFYLKSESLIQRSFGLLIFDGTRPISKVSSPTGRLRKLGTGHGLFILGYFQNESSKSK